MQALQYGEYVNWSLYGIEGEEAEIQELKAAATNVDKFLDIAYKYTDLQELTPEVLRTFIAKVVIHERSDKWSKSAEQQIDIHFRYIGNFTS